MAFGGMQPQRFRANWAWGCKAGGKCADISHYVPARQLPAHSWFVQAGRVGHQLTAPAHDATSSAPRHYDMHGRQGRTCSHPHLPRTRLRDVQMNIRLMIWQCYQSAMQITCCGSLCCSLWGNARQGALPNALVQDWVPPCSTGTTPTATRGTAQQESTLHCNGLKIRQYPSVSCSAG